ncbi:hypothetical protein J7E24_11545 [Hymenobacter sp. ISL-91]|uniref:hypothetical protein n=1 Tax=Hymenobacter sp. ISL-91 TaxID=2819151 RepID=UPI001BE9FA4C|nr:hypothetical protein [Hymenobacter sp. ISL-91]MBT2558421.1 hypothetical protein [Hymenobacter sp. ISL-91]
MNYRYALPLLLLSATACSRKPFFQPDARVAHTTPLPPSADSALVTAGRHYQRGLVGRFVLGPHYRRAWAEPVTLPVFRPEQLAPGGLKFVKMGGGFQTTSLTMADPAGRSYAVRTIDKNPEKTLPKFLRSTFVFGAVRDATSAAMPYGAFVVPPLAKAAGVPHSSPRPYYVRPDETGLGPESERFQGRVVLVERRYEGKENIDGPVAGAADLDETEDVLPARYENQRDQLDGAAFVRARLLDMWLGDWDRHEGQWSWAAYPQPDRQRRWQPVPQDRDQVFFRFDDGWASWVVSKAVAKFRTFGPRYESIAGYTRNASFIDSRALPAVPRAAYLAAARELQQRLTDTVIEQAVRQGLPPAVYTYEGPRMIAGLKARRAKLPRVADEFYRLQAEEVMVAGTDEKERFVVERLSDTATVVSVYSLEKVPEGQLQGQLLYSRSFDPRDTKTVRLHGLKGKDEFLVSGKVRRSPFIDIYGGPHEDLVRDSSRVAGLRKRTRFFDTARNNDFQRGSEIKNKTAHDVLSHAFDRDGSGR